MDRFDEIWKNRFNDGDIPIEDWNSPDDELVWKGIAPHIEPKNDNRKKVIFWWTLGALIFLLLAYLFFQKGILINAQIKPKVAPTEINKTELKPSSVDNQLKQLDSTRKEESDNVGKEVDQKVVPVEVEKKTSIRKAIDRNLKAINALERSLEELKQKTIIENKEPIDQTLQLKISNDKKPFLSPENIQKVPVLTVKSLSFEKLRSLDFYPTLNDQIEEDQKKSKFALSINSGLTYWTHRISSAYTNDLSAFDFNFTDNFGWQANMSVNYAVLPKFELFAGLQYEQVRVESGHNLELSYSMEDEVDHSHSYTRPLATPYGTAAASFRFNRSEDLGPNDIVFLADFESEHLIKNWSMPIGLNFYPLGKTSKWNVAGSVAFGINYLEKIENKISGITSHHGALSYSSDGTGVYDEANIKTWHYDLRLGAGVQYQLGTTMQIQVQYNWNRGLNPIFEQDEYETRIDRHHLELGVLKSF